MYWLRLTSPPEAADRLAGELWAFGTAGIREIETDGALVLLAHFETVAAREELLAHFASHEPQWGHEEERDWAAETQAAWPAREIGRRLFLAPAWITAPTPLGRERVIHNPGSACGTAEHPCSQLALCALETCVSPGYSMVDVGTGSGILAIAARRLGARMSAGVDLDPGALETARANFELNGMEAYVAVGSANCLADGCADVTIANISATVLLSILDDLIRITRTGGYLILTGFSEAELRPFEKMFPAGEVSTLVEWRCLTVRF